MSPRSTTNFRKPCARNGCTNLVKRSDTQYCSRRCGFMGTRRKIVINEDRASAPKAPSESWWLNSATFYTEARKRFPETGGAQVNRSREFTAGNQAPTFKTRAAELRRSEVDRISA